MLLQGQVTEIERERRRGQVTQRGARLTPLGLEAGPTELSMTFVYVVCSRYMMSIPIIVHVQCLNVKLFPKASHDCDIVCYDNECVLTMMIRWLAGLVVESRA